MSRYCDSMGNEVFFVGGETALFRRRGWLGRLITLFTGGPYSHAEKLVIEAGRIWAVGAHGSGVVATPLSSYVLNGESIRVRRIPRWHQAPEGWRERQAAFVFSIVGVWKYNYRKLFACLPVELFGPIFGFPSREEEISLLTDAQRAAIVRRVTCSQLSSQLDIWFPGIDPCLLWSSGTTTPNDLAKAPPRCVLEDVADELHFLEAA